MSHKRPLDVVAPEQEAAPSPRKRLRRTVLVMMWLDRRRRARPVTVEQMAQIVRQVQLDMAKLFMLLVVLVARLGSMETLLLQLPTILAAQIDSFRRTVTGSIEDTIRSVLRAEIQKRQGTSIPNGDERSRYLPIYFSCIFSLYCCEYRCSIKTSAWNMHMHSSSGNAVYKFSGSCYDTKTYQNRQMLERLRETGCSSGVVKLRFVDADRPKDPLYTGSPVQWQNGQNPKVAIFGDGKQIMGGDLSKLQIEILPVHADFFTERGQEDFTEEEFNKQIHMYKGKESVLTTVNLRNGEACLGSIIFTECSYRKKFRLIARVKRQDLTVSVQKAITDPFVVKDRRSELNEKSNLPSKGDAVHQLKKISQKGKRCTALMGKNITTVKHLLRQYHKDKSGLQKLTGMKKDDWSTMINHATTCDPGDEIYSYRVAEGELLFNDFYDLVGMMINGYVPVRDLDQFQQLKVNNWKMSAYENFEERENSGGLVPDYLMRNGQPVHAVPLNNEAGPSVQARTTWQYPNDMAAQQGASLTGQQISSLTADAFGTSCPVAVVELGQHHPFMPQNGTPYYLAERNILNGQGSFSGQPTIPSHIILPVREDDLIAGASPTDQQNGYLSSLMTDAPGTSCPVTDGPSQGTSSFNHVAADFWSGLSPIEEFLPQVNLADQGFNDAELLNSNNQFDDYEHDGGNQ